MWLLNSALEAVAVVVGFLAFMSLSRFIDRHNKLRWQQARWHLPMVGVLCVYAVITSSWVLAWLTAGIFALNGWIWVRQWK